MTEITPSAPAPAIFAFVSHSIRVVFIDGNPWFVLQDLLDAMGSSTQPSVAVASIKQGLGDGVNAVYPILDSLNREQQATIVAEAGATYLVSRSNTDTGRRLNRFLHAEVLPTLRKTGRYELHQVKPSPISNQQRVQLRQAIDLALTGCYHDLGNGGPAAVANRLRVRFGVASLDDLPADRFQEALAEVARVQADLRAYFTFRAELRDFVVREIIGAGTPWTPDLARKWRAKMGHTLPDRPEWMQIQRQLLAS